MRPDTKGHYGLDRRQTLALVRWILQVKSIGVLRLLFALKLGEQVRFAVALGGVVLARRPVTRVAAIFA
ncbi:MAG: hypothetical protein ABI224_03395, partial [Acetobacteraceae bacterium]